MDLFPFAYKGLILISSWDSSVQPEDQEAGLTAWTATASSS